MEERGGAGSRRVLVVDDEVAVARVVERVLVPAGFAVTAVNRGSDAVAELEKQSFDVILSDIQMPGMTGVELLRAVRKHDLDVPVILMTGEPKVETAIEAVSLGAMQYLVKPVHNDELVRVVERASQLHRMAQIKRNALDLVGSGSDASDLVGLGLTFDRALESMWLAFQPIVDLDRASLYGYEALMRSREPSLPHPGAVLEAGERLGRLPEVGRRVRMLAAAAFQHAPPQTLLFVNLHTNDLLDPELYLDSDLQRIANRVVLEITERSALDSVPDVPARVAALREKGFRLAIDDLGAGYAGLSSFASLEPEIVKLDMSLVRDIQLSPIRQRLIASMTSLCREMRLRVIAEGIETAAELATLRTLDCDLYQGYLFSKPGPPFPVPTFVT